MGDSPIAPLHSPFMKGESTPREGRMNKKGGESNKGESNKGELDKGELRCEESA